MKFNLEPQTKITWVIVAVFICYILSLPKVEMDESHCDYPSLISLLKSNSLVRVEVIPIKIIKDTKDERFKATVRSDLLLRDLPPEKHFKYKANHISPKCKIMVYGEDGHECFIRCYPDGYVSIGRGLLSRSKSANRMFLETISTEIEIPED